MSRATDLEKAVSRYLDLKGYWYLRIGNYRCFKCGQVMNSKASGWPDFFIYGPDNVLAAECKTGRGRLTPLQKEVRERLESSGITYIVVRDTVDKLLETLEEG